MSTFPLALWKEPQQIGALTVAQPAMSQVENVVSQQFPYFFAPELSPDSTFSHNPLSGALTPEGATYVFRN